MRPWSGMGCGEARGAACAEALFSACRVCAGCIEYRVSLRLLTVCGMDSCASAQAASSLLFTLGG